MSKFVSFVKQGPHRPESMKNTPRKYGSAKYLDELKYYLSVENNAN